MLESCPYRTPLGESLVQCEWLTRRMGSVVANTLGVCRACQQAGAPADGHPELESRLTEALKGRVVAWRPEADRIFNGLTCRKAAQRLAARGVDKDELRDVLLRAVGRHGMPAAKALDLAKELDL
jgi:hypothetical protein